MQDLLSNRFVQEKARCEALLERERQLERQREEESNAHLSQAWNGSGFPAFPGFSQEYTALANGTAFLDGKNNPAS